MKNPTGYEGGAHVGKTPAELAALKATHAGDYGLAPDASFEALRGPHTPRTFYETPVTEGHIANMGDFVPSVDGVEASPESSVAPEGSHWQPGEVIDVQGVAGMDFGLDSTN